jgi:hypothetical protein
MRVYFSSEPTTPEEIITHALANVIYMMDPQLLDVAYMPPIKDIYAVGSSIFIHLCNGDLYNLSVQRMTPELESD